MTEKKKHVGHKQRIMLLLVALAVAAVAAVGAVVQLPGWDQKRAADAPTTSTPQGESSVRTTSGEAFTSIMDHGAIGDGKTSDHAAWNAAVDATAEGGTLILPPDRVFALPHNLIIDKTIKISGRGATVVKPPNSSPVNDWFVVTADAVAIEGITFSDPSDLVTGSVIFARGVNHFQVKSNAINARKAISVQLIDNRETVVEGNAITGAREGITLSGPSEEVRIADNTVAQWRNFGIYLYGRQSGAPSRVEIIGNQVTDLAPGGYPRYPIHTSPGKSSTRVTDLLILSNVVLGPETSFLGEQGGTADQISVHSVNDVRVEANVSRGGGDVGITVENCRNATVRHNVVSTSDTAGIAVFSHVVGASVTHNTLIDNGQNRAGNRRPPGRAGIRLGTSKTKGPRDVQVTDNVTGNTQGSQTQKYGVSVRDSTSVVVGPNVNVGNALSHYLDETNNNGLSLVDDPAG